MFNDRQEVIEFTAPLVVGSFGLPDAAKVEAHCRPAGLHKGPGHGLHDFVVQRTAEQRVRVREHRDARTCAGWRIDGDLDRTGRAFNDGFLGLRVHGDALVGVEGASCYKNRSCLRPQILG